MFLSNFIETTLRSVTKETSQYTKSLRKKIEDIDKKIKISLLERMENENLFPRLVNKGFADNRM